MEPQVQTQEIQTIKEKKSPLTAILIVVILVLGVAAAYMYIKPKDNGMPKEENKITEEKKEDTTLTQDQTTGTQPNTETGTTGTTTADIDGDLKSIDSLDLSGIENDYSEDNINDLN